MRQGQIHVYGGYKSPEEGARTITPIIQNEAYGLYVRRTYIRGQWHIELIRKMPEYTEPLITEFFLSPDELQLLRESLR
jgi:hypothetical protein